MQRELTTRRGRLAEPTATASSPSSSTARRRRATPRPVLRSQHPLRAERRSRRANSPTREPIFRWWRERGHPAPLLLTEQEVAHRPTASRSSSTTSKSTAASAARRATWSAARRGRFVLPRARWSTNCAPSCCACGRRRRHAVGPRPAAALLARFDLHVLRAVPPCPRCTSGRNVPAAKSGRVVHERRGASASIRPFRTLLDVREEKTPPQGRRRGRAFLANYLKQDRL